MITRRDLITDDAINFGLEYEKNVLKAIEVNKKLLQSAVEIDGAITKINSAGGNQQYLQAKREEITLSTKAAGLLIKESQVRQNIQKERQQALRTQKQEIDLQNKKNRLSQQSAKLTQQEKLEIRLKNKEEREEAILSSTLVGAYQKLNLQRTQAKQRLQDLTVSLGKNNSKTKEAQAEFNKLDARVRKADLAVKDFGKNVGNYPNQMGRATASLRNLATALGVVGGVTLLAREIKNSVGIIRDFEKANATLSGVLQVEKEEMQDLEQDARRLGATTVKTASEVTQLQLAYARLGFSQEQIIDLTEATISGSIALNSNLAETAELTGAMVNSFDEFSAADAPEILDILSLATAKTALDFGKLQNALPIVSGAANAAGIPFTRLTALLGKLADAGIDTSTSATALRNIFIESSKQGLSYEQILDKIANSSDKLTASTDEFGKRAAVSANVLAQNIEATDELDKALQGAAGTADRMAKKELDTLDGAVKLLNSAWEGFILNLNESTDAGGILTDAIRFLAENLDTILNTLGLLTGAWLLYRTTLLAVSLISRAYTAGVIALRVAKIALSGGIAGVTRAMRLLNIQFAASPIGLFAVALAGLVLAINKYGREATAAEKAQRAFNDAQKEAEKSTVKEKAALETLLAVAKDETKSKEERRKAIESLNEISPEYLGNLTLENINTAEGTRLINGYIEALDKKALAQALQTKKEELYTKQINLQNSSLEDSAGWFDYLASAVEGLGTAQGTSLALAERSLENRQEEGKAIQDEIDALDKLIAAKLKSGEIDATDAVGGSSAPTTGSGRVDTSRLQARNKAIFDLEQMRIKIARDAEEEIVKDYDEAIRERLIRVNNLVDLEQQLLSNRYEFERANIIRTVKDAETRNAQLTLLELKYKEDKEKIVQEREANVEKILQDAFAKAKVRIDEEKRLVEENLEEETQGLREQLARREISLQQYTDSVKDLRNQANKDALQAVIDQVDSELEATELSNEEVVKLEKIKQDALKALRDAEFDDVVEREKKILELRKELLDTTSQALSDAFGFDSANIRRFLDGLVNGFDSAADSVSAALNVVGEVGNSIFQGRIDEIDQQIAASEEFYARQAELAQGDEDQQELIRQEGELRRQQLEKKKRKEQRRQAIFDKAIAISNVGINTAAAVMKTLATTPLPFGAPLVTLTIALGALQAAAIAAKPIPKFKDGHLAGTYEGLAITNDGRRNGKVVPEVWERNGKAQVIQGKDTLIDMKKGDKIHSSIEDYINSRRNSSLMSLSSQGSKVDSYQAAMFFNNSESINEEKIINAFKKAIKGVKINNVNNIPKQDFGFDLWASQILNS